MATGLAREAVASAGEPGPHPETRRVDDVEADVGRGRRAHRLQPLRSQVAQPRGWQRRIEHPASTQRHESLSSGRLFGKCARKPGNGLQHVCAGIFDPEWQPLHGVRRDGLEQPRSLVGQGCRAAMQRDDRHPIPGPHLVDERAGRFLHPKCRGRVDGAVIEQEHHRSPASLGGHGGHLQNRNPVASDPDLQLARPDVQQRHPLPVQDNGVDPQVGRLSRCFGGARRLLREGDHTEQEHDGK